MTGAPPARTDPAAGVPVRAIKRRGLFWPLLIGLLLVGSRAEAASGLAGARAWFARYQALERAFDPALADLYADRAVIWVTRAYASGAVRQLKIPGELYKQLLRQSMPLARAHGDYNLYTDVRYRREGKGVRIRATRYSVWLHYRSPYSVLIAPDVGGRWRAVEERLRQRVPAGH